MNWLLTLSGPDKPGITSTITRVLSIGELKLIDIEQVVVQGQLILSLSLRTNSKSNKPPDCFLELELKVAQLGQQLSYRLIPDAKERDLKRRYVLTVMADPVTVPIMYEISALLAKHDANIETIRRLSHGNLSSLEISLSIEESESKILKQALLEKLSKSQVDIALQRETLSRRNKRLVVLDMDSTLIQHEVIDELAKIHGVYAQVSAITEQAMSQGLDFSESLKKRVGFLKDLESAKHDQVLEKIELGLGVESLIKVLRKLGYDIGIISGGFEGPAIHFKNKLGLDFAYANKLEFENGRLTGRVLEPILDARRKADLLETIAQAKNIPLEQTIAIGDGANDALMLSKAGLGIAYRAKPILKEKADTTISFGGLERILYLLGIHDREIHEFV